MDSLVLKYLIWVLLAYGLHALFALLQILLCGYLISNGIYQLYSLKDPGKWAKRFGLMLNRKKEKRRWSGSGMIAAGIALILPFLIGAPYWLSIIACLAAVILIVQPEKQLPTLEQKSGRIARRILVFSAALVFGLTLWEGGDLVTMSKSVISKAKYWREKEVEGWQVTHNPNIPKIGEMAPDFELTDNTGTKTIRLSDFRGEKPVVLVFGSFT